MKNNMEAHALYNSAAVRDKANGENREKWSQKAFEVQKTYWGQNVEMTYDEQKWMMDDVKDELTQVRESTQSKLDYINENCTDFDYRPDHLMSEHNKNMSTLFNSQVDAASKHCTESMVKLFSLIVEKAVNVIGKVPCGFCAAAMGSTARGEATPYSDLEFLFLLERNSPDIAKYFEGLAMTVYFIIGNLQETKLRYMAIEELSEWFEDVSTNGLKIDGLQKQAGNIPTGNGSCKQHNHFICTVDELVARYAKVFSNPDPKESLKGDLTAMLSTTIPFFGECALLKSFQERIQQLETNEARQNASRKMLLNDAKRYDFHPDMSMQQTRNLKSDIYRYPSLLAFDLKIIHGINESSVALFDELLRRGITSYSTDQHLRFSYFAALYMRLSTYLHHKSQKESISVLKPNPEFVATRDQWYVDRPLLLYMMIHLIKLKETVSSDSLHQDHDATSSDDVKHSAAIVSYYSQDYQTCWEMLKDLVTNQTDFKTKQMLASCLLEFGRYEEAENVYLDLLHAVQTNSAKNDSDVAACYHSLGNVSEREGAYEKAVSYHEKAITIWQILYGEKDSAEKTRSYDNLGNVYFVLGNHKKSEIYYQESLEMKRRLHKNVDDEDFFTSYNNLGAVFDAQRDYKKGEIYHMKSLELAKRLYGYSDHYRIAFAYNNLGIVYGGLGDHKKAEDYHTMSIEMKFRIHGKSDHPDISSSYNNLADAYEAVGHYRKAEIYYKKALEMNKRIYGDVDHHDIVIGFINLAQVFSDLKLFKEAEDYLLKSLQMLDRLSLGSDHSYKIEVCTCLSRVYCEQGLYEKAEEFLAKSNELAARLHHDSDHPDLAKIFNYNGLLKHKRGLYEESESWYRKSMDMTIRMTATLLGNSDHTCLANSYSGLGSLYQSQGRLKEAELNHTKALEMRQRIFQNSDHPIIADSYKHLADVFNSQGESERADACLSKHAEMVGRLKSQEFSDSQTSL